MKVAEEVISLWAKMAYNGGGGGRLKSLQIKWTVVANKKTDYIFPPTEKSLLEL